MRTEPEILSTIYDLIRDKIGGDAGMPDLLIIEMLVNICGINKNSATSLLFNCKYYNWDFTTFYKQCYQY